jgi:CheY-like chemotaxis protein
MSATMMRDARPSEIGDTDAYNRLQIRRAIQSRGDPHAEPMVGGAGEPLRVLVVDNHRDFANTISRLIGIWGHQVRLAYDGPSALALAAVYQPDIVLLDVIMPHMNGMELAAELRQITGLAECFLVAVTGRADAGHRLQCDAGLDLFLIKPVTPVILKTLLTWEFEYALRARHDIAAQRPVATPSPSQARLPLRAPSTVPRIAVLGTVAS